MANTFTKPRAKQKRPQIISGAELRSLRKRAGLSLKAAATAMGVGVQTLVDYEAERYAAPKLVITMLQVLAAKRQAMITGRRKDMLDFLGQPFDVSL